MPDGKHPDRLGVGLLYNPSLPPFLRGHLDAWDYLEIIPDMFRTDNGPGRTPRFVELESWTGILDWVAARKPVVAHSIALSIGSAELFDHDYVAEIAGWNRRYNFPWHSEHLSFIQVPGATAHDLQAHGVGLAAPVPYDAEVLEMIAARIKRIQTNVPAPFLLENNVYYIDIPEQEMTEPEFLNQLSERTNCGLLLDVHNVYCNARNHGFDACGFFDQLNLDRVIEIHIAGGNELAGMYTDSHAGPCPEPVWELLDYVVARAPNLRGITFEFHDSYYPLLKTGGILEHLDRARAAFARSPSSPDRIRSVAAAL
jgi:uncharacterized protein (UPF0276 family)